MGTFWKAGSQEKTTTQTFSDNAWIRNFSFIRPSLLLVDFARYEDVTFLNWKRLSVSNSAATMFPHVELHISDSEKTDLRALYRGSMASNQMQQNHNDWTVQY